MTPVPHQHAPVEDAAQVCSVTLASAPDRWDGTASTALANPQASEGAAIPPAAALEVLRRGLAASPALRRGLYYIVALAVVTAAGRVLVPILIQQVLDRGVTGPAGYQPGFVYPACAVAAAVIGCVYLGGRATQRRMVTNSEAALADLRVRAFAHIQRISIAEQTSHRRGALTSRVTADIDTLSQFLQWGGISWVISVVLMAGTGAAMIVYSWRLALVALVGIVPLVVILRLLQRGMLAAYDRLRTRVGETLSEVSESVMGAAVVRAYGLERRTDQRLRAAVDRQYSSQIRAQRFAATIFPAADLFGAIAVAAVIAVAAHYGPAWGLSLGDTLAFVFLVTLFLLPLTELSETFEQTQTAIAGWRKVLNVLDLPVEIDEPAPGVRLPAGALDVVVEDVWYSYRSGGPVLSGLSLAIPSGTHVAVVGETGSGKTTLARLLARLADPTAGRVLVGGVDLRAVSPGSRRRAVRLVPQDGFLFDISVGENVRQGAPGTTDGDVEAAFVALGLEAFVAGLPDGLDTRAGERGENLSVGERQLVALARAQVAGPGLLILDEATSAVDPETERTTIEAMERLSRGRTTVTVAHRLSTAESADLVVVMEQGRIVEVGTHRELVAAGGVYAGLHRSWLGNTRS